MSGELRRERAPTSFDGYASHSPAATSSSGERAVKIDVRVDDLASAEVQSLVAEHLAGMRGHTPPEHVHALDIESLRAPSVTFWTAWVDGVLCGCGALKALDARTGEIKSMRTRLHVLRRGVGQAILDEIVRAARRRGYTRLFLETGSGPAFEPAHALYRRNGFEGCGPFGEYAATEFNVFMVKDLATSAEPPGRSAGAPTSAAP
jgi:putative acetyltransferase